MSNPIRIRSSDPLLPFSIAIEDDQPDEVLVSLTDELGESHDFVMDRFSAGCLGQALLTSLTVPMDNESAVAFDLASVIDLKDPHDPNHLRSR